MKTSFIVTLETSDMKTLYEGEDGWMKVCVNRHVPTVTDDVECEMHSLFEDLLKNHLEEYFRDKVLDDSVTAVEGFEDLDDYGNVRITVERNEAVEYGKGK